MTVTDLREATDLTVVTDLTVTDLREATDLRAATDLTATDLKEVTDLTVVTDLTKMAATDSIKTAVTVAETADRITAVATVAREVTLTEIRR